MSSSTFILTSAHYAKEDVPLASLVPDIRYPNQDALTKIEVRELDDYSGNIDKEFQLPQNFESKSFFKAAIAGIFSVARDDRHISSDRVDNS